MARREAEDQDAQPLGAIRRLVLDVKEKLLLPVRLATSKFALRAYLTSILFFVTALLLFAIAVIAYILFYWSYIPRIGFSRTIHLQYDTVPLECRTYLAQISAYPPPGQQSLLSNIQGKAPVDLLSPALAARCASTPAPWGTAAIAPELIGQQAYDVVAELTMPRTPSNLDAGNFMLSARLLSSQLMGFTDPFSATAPAAQAEDPTLAHARRPAILPYRSPLLALYDTLLSLPRATFGLATETAALRVPLFTRVSFPRGRARVPAAVHLQLQAPSGAQLAVYSAEVHFRARFTGLRYVMYNFRLATGAVFVGAFFVAEAVAALAVYAVLGFVVFGQPAAKPEQGKVKAEDDGADTDARLSDAERTFPSYGGGPPLKFEGRNRIKTEPVDDDVGEGSSCVVSEAMQVMTPGPGGDADDEDDEDADFLLDDAGRWRDSGLGTSMESGLERGGVVRKRRSRGGSGTGLR